ncbi:MULTISPECIES: tubulin-like doman-containing protein [Haloferax]|uniref:Tubulin like n=1 Tax=Haloferax marinum TaxID=2666143 RepID=A0A6A8GAR9_9EURY|nr:MULTISPECIES: tubulin-like doman-containing protein [Haloferax]KAB1190645.1 hypothetical protein Hfx1150_16535 [Haloferax sp. CBA1150]MRW98174.1 hypothetical protein [Haloferax marinum]
MSHSPTVVVGVGHAGISVLSMLDTIPHDDEDAYSYVAVDTDKEQLTEAPPDAKRIYLTENPALVEEHLLTTPYLPESVEIQPKGSARQRPVGRYKLESTMGPGFRRLFETLKDEILDHVRSHELEFDPGTTSVDIFLVNSLGGGTGSGTFPLLLGLLQRVTSKLEEDLGYATYVAGVGFVPEIPVGLSAHQNPLLRNSYTNAYAALCDLKRLIGIHDREESLTVQQLANLGESSAYGSDSIDMAAVPFDDYWFVGVDEEQVADRSAVDARGVDYVTSLDRDVAHAISAIGGLDQHAKQWAFETPYTGTFERGTVSVPHETVRTFAAKCEAKAEILTRLEEELPAEIESKRARRDDLRELKDYASSDTVPDDLKLRRAVSNAITESLTPNGTPIESNEPANVKSFFERMSEHHGVEGELVAGALLDRRLHEDGTLSNVDGRLEDTVRRLWTKYNIESRPTYQSSSVESDMAVLEEFLGDRIDEYTADVDDWDPTVFDRLQDMLPPVIEAFESEREYAEWALEMLRADRSELAEVRETWRRVHTIADVIEETRATVRHRIDERLADTEAEITSLSNERDDVKREYRALEREVNDLREELSEPTITPNHTVLPIDDERVTSLDSTAEANRLESLEDYVERELVDVEKLTRAVGRCTERCETKTKSMLEQDCSESDTDQRFSASDELWGLCHESNTDLVRQLSRVVQGNQRFSGQSVGHIDDPFRIECFLFRRRGPLSSLTRYHKLMSMAEDGVLDELATQYNDYRHAFAYPELYSRNTIGSSCTPARVSLTQPPELSLDCIDKSGLSDDELTDFVKTTGLGSYLYLGTMWDEYDDSEAQFTGWKSDLREFGLSWKELQQASPSTSTTSEWLAGNIAWSELLEEYRENLANQMGIRLAYE